MIAIRIGCHEAPTPGRPDAYPCPYLDLYIETPEELPTAITTTLGEHGWTHTPDGYHCPRHHPDLHGLRVVLSHDYTELVPGIQIRLDYQGYAKAELLLDETHYDVDTTARSERGAAWRAKHVSEDWPT